MVPTRVDPQTLMPLLCCRFFSPSKTCYGTCCSFARLGMLECWLGGQLAAPPFSSTIQGSLLEFPDVTEIHRAAFTDIALTATTLFGSGSKGRIGLQGGSPCQANTSLRLLSSASSRGQWEGPASPSATSCLGCTWLLGAQAVFLVDVGMSKLVPSSPDLLFTARHCPPLQIPSSPRAQRDALLVWCLPRRCVQGGTHLVGYPSRGNVLFSSWDAFVVAPAASDAISNEASLRCSPLLELASWWQLYFCSPDRNLRAVFYVDATFRWGTRMGTLLFSYLPCLDCNAGLSSWGILAIVFVMTVHPSSCALLMGALIVVPS